MLTFKYSKNMGNKVSKTTQKAIALSWMEDRQERNKEGVTHHMTTENGLKLNHQRDHFGVPP